MSRSFGLRNGARQETRVSLQVIRVLTPAVLVMSSDFNNADVFELSARLRTASLINSHALACRLEAGMIRLLLQAMALSVSSLPAPVPCPAWIRPAEFASSFGLFPI